VLTGIEKLKICVAYKYKGTIIEEFPASLNVLAECEPIYEELDGWNEDITKANSLNDLPLEARHYMERVSQLTGIPIAILSVGPNRQQTINLRSVFA